MLVAFFGIHTKIFLPADNPLRPEKNFEILSKNRTQFP